jgi:hypothetical protein
MDDEAGALGQDASVRELHLDDHRFCVRGTGLLEDVTFLCYEHRPATRRPYLGVLAGPSGRNVLECPPADRAHHLGVWWALGDVNGVDFAYELERPDLAHGRVEHVAFEEVVDDDPWFGFDEHLEWRDADGAVLLRELRIVLAHFAHDAWTTVDLESTLTAAEPLVLGPHAECHLPGVRVAERLAPSGGGTVSRPGPGAEDGADWIDCSGARRSLGGSPLTEGIAVMADPRDAEATEAASVADEGLVSTAAGRRLRGGRRLQAGETLHHRHRLFVHAATAAEAEVAAHYARWLSEEALE